MVIKKAGTKKTAQLSLTYEAFLNFGVNSGKKSFRKKNFLKILL